jgi:ATP-dependent helicase/nuclease subunit B
MTSAPPTLHFLGWSRPAAETVGDFLLAGVPPQQPLDLEGTLLVVPTRQAGRHLLDALVQRCGATGSAVLSQRLLTPTQLGADALRGPAIASGAEVLAAWSDVLAAASEPVLGAAFGAAARLRDPVAAIPVAERLQQVRRELAEGARTCADVAAHAAATDAEPERWQALAQLEAAFVERLARHGLIDACRAQVAWAAAPSLAPEVRRLVVAFVPDPSLLFLRALERLDRRVRIDVLVQAPPEAATQFDAWGRPLADHWNACRIDLPDEEQNLILAADPADQAARALEIVSAAARGEAEPRGVTVADTAVGVPDRAVVPFLLEQFAARGIRAFDPQERPLREHALARLVERLLELRRAVPYRTVADLLRHPDVLLALQDTEPPLPAAELLAQLDAFQNRHLPLGLPDLLRPFAGNPRGTTDRHADFTLLGQALQRIARWREQLATGRLPTALRTLLAEIYASRTLDPDTPADRLFAAAAEAIDRVLRELEESRGTPPAPDVEAAILLARLRAQGCAPERNDEAIDLEGWLELPWNRAPLLLVTGLNEGCVPDGRLADDFLPDTLRRALALRDDRLRAARDAFLLHVLLAARADGRGRLCLLCGKTSAEGDPLRPSRLLFRCADEQLPQRARRLFGALPPARAGAPATVGFRLRPFALPPAAPRGATPTISVTACKDYLRCPFRFYLRHRLDMEPLADDALAPDELAFGNLVHGVLEAFGRDGRLAQSTDAGTLAASLETQARAAFAAAYGPQPSLAVQVALDSAIQRLARFAALQAGLAREWEIVATETRFELSRGGFTLIARIDRIDRHRADGRLRVMDYKTFDKVRSPADTHLGPCRADAPAFAQVELPSQRGRARRKAWLDLQLPLYREVLRADGRFGGVPVELGYLVLPRAIGETDFYPWVDYTDDLHAAALACADGVLAALAAGTFWPPRDVPAAWDDFAPLFTGTPEQCFVPPSSLPDARTPTE